MFAHIFIALIDYQQVIISQTASQLQYSITTLFLFIYFQEQLLIGIAMFVVMGKSAQ